MTESGKLLNLVRELAAFPAETEWLEFKHNNADPADIGEYISALSNSAVLHKKQCAYIAWGIADRTHEVIGTSFRPRQTKIGNEELENWLVTQLDPRIDVRIRECDVEGTPIVLFEIQPAFGRPVRFKGVEYVRVGTYKKRLHDHPEKERLLWRIFEQTPFEKGIAKRNATADEVLALLDYPNYFRLAQAPLPENREAILDRLTLEGLIARVDGDGYDISNIGATLFARNLKEFDRLARKALRIVVYSGDNRVKAVKEQERTAGYGVDFEEAIRYVNDQLPRNEQIGQALRREMPAYPEIAVRELVANALIHQDFSVIGAGPMVEIFSDRMEISNPGQPLIDTRRFIDEPPRSRNEALASLMRRLNICEERGSGIDKVIFSVELFQLPAPDFRVAGDGTVAVLYSPRQFAQMDRQERMRACYQHACIQYVSGKRMSNASLRKRLGITDANYPLASRIIRDTIEADLLKAHGEGSGAKKTATYVPYWV